MRDARWGAARWRPRIPRFIAGALPVVVVAVIWQPRTGFAQEQELPVYLRDRGTGLPVSQFGTYVRDGQLLVYPFYEYYHDDNLEYEPFDFGYGSEQEFRGRYRAHEVLLFLGYGITDRLALELEAGVISAQLDKASGDPSAVPAQLEESGLSDVEGQLRWRWNHESARTPEVFTYFETVFPTGEQNSLIGTSDWEFKLGTGLIKGFRWGTLTLRAAVDYSAAENSFALGEYALEYLKRLSDRWRTFLMVEGSEDEVALVPELQFQAARNLVLKANAGIGLTSKATDWAPEFGIMFSFW